MSSSELDLLRRLRRSVLGEADLVELLHAHRDRYRVQLELVQQPRFPPAQALNIMSRLYAVDLLRVIRNTRANPFIRQRAQLEFGIRFRRLPLGEKLSLIRMAPPAVLLDFGDEQDPLLLQAIFASPMCTEDVVLRFVNRTQDRAAVYRGLQGTDWHMNAIVAGAIAHDPEAPIRTLLQIIPFAGLTWLQKLVGDGTCHPAVRDAVRRHLNERGRE